MTRNVRKTQQRKQQDKTDFEVFTILNDAVAAEYHADSCKAGVITSKIQHDPPLYYVAIARYGNSHVNKQLIVAVKDTSFAAAIRTAADAWLQIVMPPPKEDLKQKLQRVLR